VAKIKLELTKEEEGGGVAMTTVEKEEEAGCVC